MKSFLSYAYTNWAYMCLPLAFYTALIILSSFYSLELLVVLIWLHFSAYLLHQFEEHAYPGGFKDYINKNTLKPKSQQEILTNKSVFWINILYIWLLFPLFAVLAQNYALAFGVLVVYSTLFNSFLHIGCSLIKKTYNPGLITSVLLFLPLSLYTISLMHTQAHV